MLRCWESVAVFFPGIKYFITHDCSSNCTFQNVSGTQYERPFVLFGRVLMGRIPVWKMETLFCRRTGRCRSRDLHGGTGVLQCIDVYGRNVLMEQKEPVLVLYDREEEYARLFSEYLKRQKELTWQIHNCKRE